MADSLPLTADVSPIDLAAYLLKNGVKVIGKPTPITDRKDGEIKISTHVYVQVGRGYAYVHEGIGVESDPDYALMLGIERHDGLDVLTDIQAKTL